MKIDDLLRATLADDRWELPAEVAMVVSNHETLRPAAERFGIPFHHFPITKENRDEQELSRRGRRVPRGRARDLRRCGSGHRRTADAPPRAGRAAQTSELVSARALRPVQS